MRRAFVLMLVALPVTSVEPAESHAPWKHSERLVAPELHWGAYLRDQTQKILREKCRPTYNTTYNPYWTMPEGMRSWALRTWKQRFAQAKRLASRCSPRAFVDSCLNELIMRESGWNVYATNPITGAYGLPQALPGSKMASAGADWRHNPWTQIRWMRGYIRANYGTTCAALNFQIANGWY